MDPPQAEAADAHFERALSLMQGLALPAARLRIEWAQVLRQRGESQPAEALHEEALATLRAAGWLHVVHAIEQAVAPSPSPAPPAAHNARPPIGPPEPTRA
jgi:hypothetical protein